MVVKNLAMLGRFYLYYLYLEVYYMQLFWGEIFGGRLKWDTTARSYSPTTQHYLNSKPADQGASVVIRVWLRPQINCQQDALHAPETYTPIKILQGTVVNFLLILFFITHIWLTDG